MIKKFLSVILSISMLLSMVVATNVFASTAPFAELDLTSKNIGDVVTMHGGTGNVAIVVSEDNEKVVLVGGDGEAYSSGENTVKLLNYTGVSGSETLSTVSPKGVVFESTMKVENTEELILTSSTSKVSPRYITLLGGKVYYNTKQDGSKIETGLAYPTGVWFTVKFSWNVTTGYLEISVKNLSTGVETEKSFTLSGWVKANDALTAKTFSWYSTSSTNHIYIKNMKILTENDADAIAPPAPSRMIVKDDFDSATSVVSPWSSATAMIASTDRGNSVKIGSDGTQQLYIKNTAGVLPTTAKGLVAEFSVKLSGSQNAGMIFSLDKGNKYYQTDSNLIKFETDNDIVFFGGLLESGLKWEKDKWYDIRIEVDFGSKNIRYIFNDGLVERVYNKTYSHTYFDDLALNTYLSFTAEKDDIAGVDYIDNVNIYWLDSASASGISKEYASNPVNINFENYAEGTEAITNDLSCTTPMSGYSSQVTYAIESVKNSGRGKSLKITTNDAVSHTLHKDTTPIQNGSYSFDIMVPAIDGQNDGIVIINAQVATASNGQSTTKDLLRFSNWGYITDGGNNNICTYKAGKWYKVILTAGSDAATSDGQVNTMVYDENGNKLVDKTVSFGSYNDGTNLIPRDSIQYARIEMIQNPNTIYIDNYKAYKPSATPAGIYPVGQSALKESVVSTEDKIILPFSKPVDLSKSVFKVNGEGVSASGYEYITLNTELKAGEEYEIEYTVYDLDGFKTEGYISGISCEGIFTVASYTKATLSSPTATASVKVSAAAGSKDVTLYVAAYSDGEMIALNADSKTLTAETGSFTATVNASGADEIKTFLWDGKTLTPIK